MVDKGLLDTAANNFDTAQWMKPPVQAQRMALGLLQLARAVKADYDESLIETAANNLDSAQWMRAPEVQMQRIALGLMQLARGLKGRPA